jgi:hypothetical protein
MIGRKAGELIGIVGIIPFGVGCVDVLGGLCSVGKSSSDVFLLFSIRGLFRFFFDKCNPKYIMAQEGKTEDQCGLEDTNNPNHKKLCSGGQVWYLFEGKVNKINVIIDMNDYPIGNGGTSPKKYAPSADDLCNTSNNKVFTDESNNKSTLLGFFF